MAQQSIRYLSGFGNEHETEALPQALPVGQFNPQKVNYGLYAEQFSTTAFTAPRAKNRRTWFYRIRPSVSQGSFHPLPTQHLITAPNSKTVSLPNQLRWDPLPWPSLPIDFVDSLTTMAVNGDAGLQIGIGIHSYCATQSMNDRFFCNSDGELLIVPQLGELKLHTECGLLAIAPGDIAVIPRGLKFRVELGNEKARGYVCENYGHCLELPERGPVGANGFANTRDFYYPVAAFEDKDTVCELVTKFNGQLFRCELDHSPLDVVAWVGNSAPYKYELARFNVINTVSYDHPDPSIFTVLTSTSDTPGVANLDFVIFPPRWMVAEHTFRPPWYHRNVMSEFMGLIQGAYDAKEEGFVPGGASLHNCMSPHGPDAAAFKKASEAKLVPEQYQDTLAFMFETRYLLQTTEFAMTAPALQQHYHDCWKNITKHFDGKK